MTERRVEDQNGVNVLPLFQWVQSDFLALCGCCSRHCLEIVKEYRGDKMETFKYMYGFSGHIEAKVSLKKSIIYFKSLLHEGNLGHKADDLFCSFTETVDSEADRIAFTIRRKCSAREGSVTSACPEAEILIHGKQAAILPPMGADKQQSAKFDYIIPPGMLPGQSISELKDTDAGEWFRILSGLDIVLAVGCRAGHPKRESWLVEITADGIPGSWQLVADSEELHGAAVRNQMIYHWTDQQASDPFPD